MTPSSSSPPLASHVLKLREAPAHKISNRLKALEAEGRTVFNLALGELYFITPSHITHAIKQAVDDGKTGYTPTGGTDEVKKAIIDKFHRDNGLSYKPDEIITCSGSLDVISNGIKAMVSPGNEVLLPVPGWDAYGSVVALAGGVLTPIRTRAENNYKMTPEELDRAITPKTRCLILNSPNNPTGAVYSKRELGALAQVLDKHPDVWILSDEIYEKILYDNNRFASIAQVSEKMKERTLVVNGLSKSHAMTGLRFGFGAANARLISAMKTVQTFSAGNPCSIIQPGAVAALNGDHAYLNDWLPKLQKNRDTVLKTVGLFLPCQKADGAFYTHANIEKFIGVDSDCGTIETPKDFAAHLLEQTGVAVLPGEAFGSPDPTVRISFAAKPEKLEEACSRISDFCLRLEGITPVPAKRPNVLRIHNPLNTNRLDC